MLMLIAGLSELIVIYLIDYLILYVYLQNILAPELTDRILLTSLPWYIGGITAYSLDVYKRQVRYNSLSRAMAAPNSNEAGEHDGVFLPFQFVGTQKVDNRPFGAYVLSLIHIYSGPPAFFRFLFDFLP